MDTTTDRAEPDIRMLCSCPYCGNPQIMVRVPDEAETHIQVTCWMCDRTSTHRVREDLLRDCSPYVPEVAAP
jgi:hypothetical protein